MLAYLVRHAESLTNAQQGAGMNPTLSPLGIRQVQALTHRFADAQFTALYSSPFRRCLETAEPLAAGKSCPIRIRPELHECYYLPQDRRLDTELPELSQVLAAHPRAALCEDWRGPVSWPSVHETREDLFARMRGFAGYLKQRWGETDVAVLIISHGSPLAKLVDAWLTDVPGPSYRYAIDNATVTALRYEKGVGTLVCLNERSHLIGLPAPEVANFETSGAIKPQRPPLH